MCKYAVFHITKERVESKLYSFLTWSRDGGERSASRPYRFASRKGLRHKLNELEIWSGLMFREKVLPLPVFEPQIIQPVA